MKLLLNIDPDTRITAEQALQHPYLANYADPDDEVCLDYFVIIHYSLQPIAPLYDDSFEKMELDAEGWKSMVFLL